MDCGVATDERRDEADGIDGEVWRDNDVEPNMVEERSDSEITGLPICRIPKVPATLKNGQNQRLPEWIRPSVVSIGPYYYDHKNLRKAQKLKSRHADEFIKETNQDKNALYRKIKKKIQELRKCYDSQEISKYDDRRLATIFLLDGCFLLHFINCRGEDGGFNNLDFTNHEISYIKQDLFLLENQLPYRVLKLLFKDIPKSRQMPSMGKIIEHFVASHVPFPRGIISQEDEEEQENEQQQPSCHHLLHYLQKLILNGPRTNSPRPRPRPRDNKTDDHRDKSSRRKPRWQFSGQNQNVQELKKVGIHFKPSPTSCLKDISFKPHIGATACLKLPVVSMNTSTMITFLNLIAFESSNPTNNCNQLGVISYLCFLDSLIDRWDDVKELQVAGIIHNFIGDQREVAQFFNNVCNKLVPDPSAYRDVIIDIESHIEGHNKSKLRRWYIECQQKYFSSPWSSIALIAAIIGLSLTAIQAYTSVFSQ